MSAHILVADDDTAIVDAVTLILEDEGYSVTSTHSGADLYELTDPMPDLILLDIWMSGQNGGDVAKYLKQHQHTRHIPILFISANRDGKTISQEAGGDGFLAKPFDIDELLKLVASKL